MIPPPRLWSFCALSLTAHVVSLSVVQVSLTAPRIAPPRPYGALVFLGAIVAPPLAPTPQRPLEETPATHDLPPASWHGPAVLPSPLARESPQAIHHLPPRRPLPPRLFAHEKQLPHAVTRVAVTPRVATVPVWIRGPARLREVLHRPPLAPHLDRVPLTRLRSRDVSTMVELHLRFTLTASGQVDRVDVLRSSGDPLLDLVGVQYLKDWRFAALDSKEPRGPPASWGEVTLRLALEPPASP